MGRIFVCLSKRVSARWVLDADITGFFDNINHDWLPRNVRMNTRVLHQWLKAGVIDKGHLRRTEMGTPQGGIISPTLANITLNGLESGLAAHLRATLGYRGVQASKCNVVRYADDFVVTGASQEVLETIVVPWVTSFLRERGLQLSSEKTRVVHIDHGFDFLGWNFRKYRNGKMYIKPSRANVKAFYRKVSDIVERSLSLPTERLIRRLNPVLRGWAAYHKGVCSKATLSRLDQLLYWRLMRWAQRRNPQKRKARLYSKHWLELGNRRVFAVQRHNADGDVTRSLPLYRLADTKVIRYQYKVHGDYNPFDPAWELYGEQRHAKLKSLDFVNSQRQTLWLQQGGYCPVCETLLDSAGGSDDHHIVYRMHGGSHALSNRVLLHPVCHRRVHALGLEVTKPVPAQGI
ncbi:MAG: HNH endonuclease [Burkholderiales bacterium]|nr:HNH endonuclease [Burkholderiales bacterium]